MRQKTLVPLQKMASIFHIWHFHREIGMENQTNLPVIAHHGVIGLSWARASFPAWTHTSIFIHTQGGTCANTITPNSSIFLSHTHKTNLLRSSTHSCCWHPHFNFMSLFILCLLFFPLTFSICGTFLQNKTKELASFNSSESSVYPRNQALFCFTAI